MKTLLQKIKATNITNLEGEKNPYAYLTGEEFVALVNMRRAKHFHVDTNVQRWTEIEGNTFYAPIDGAITISRPQAKKIAQGFAEWSTNKEDGKPLFARVYISEWERDNSLWLSF